MVDTFLGNFNYLHPTIHAVGKFDYDIAVKRYTIILNKHRGDVA